MTISIFIKWLQNTSLHIKKDREILRGEGGFEWLSEKLVMKNDSFQDNFLFN